MSEQLQLFLALIKRYSVQVIAALAVVNSFYVSLPEGIKEMIPGWAVVAFNAIGAIVGYFGAKAPQPEVEKEVKAAVKAVEVAKVTP